FRLEIFFILFICYNRLVNSIMFEARLLNGSIFAKVIEGLRELVNEATWECSSNGITL
ncbi:unnamed protein product, partial [Rotaria magnacalcarata]